jgi:predicted small lipoprotein YifL
MSVDQNPAGHRDHARPGSAVVRALAVAVTVLTLAACGLRVETPPPVEPSPDAVEQVRARTVADSLALSAAATAAALLPDGAVEPVAPVLADVTGFSDQHADQLGGVYVSGLPAPTDSPTPTSEPTVASVAEVLEQLASATRTALTDADAVTDGPLARLVASVATSRGELATRLAQATGVEVPSLVPEAATPTDDPTPSPSSTANDALSATEVGVLALVHDEAGYGFEVIAAKLSAEQRATAESAAATHRARSEDWAAAAGIDGTAQDPRRASYTLPAGLDDPTVATALGRTLETAVADAYANAVAQAGPGSRAPLIEGLHRATVDAAVWGATPVPFPGLPERAQQPTG